MTSFLQRWRNLPVLLRRANPLSKDREYLPGVLTVDESWAAGSRRRRGSRISPAPAALAGLPWKRFPTLIGTFR